MSNKYVGMSAATKARRQVIAAQIEDIKAHELEAEAQKTRRAKTLKALEAEDDILAIENMTPQNVASWKHDEKARAIQAERKKSQ